MKIPINKMTTAQYSCSVYVISLGTAGIGLFILIVNDGFVVNPDTSANYLATVTWIGAAFTIAITVLQGRVIRIEHFRAQQVSWCFYKY